METVKEKLARLIGTEMHTHVTHWMPLPKGVQ